jgi:predicted CxxxxCH...CXXCH cytochrome family protein
MKTEWYIRLSLVIVAAVIYVGCSELKNGTQTINPVVVDVHQQGFRSPSSPDFHGNTIQQAGWEMRDCRKCHGGSYTGSTAPSCVSSGCHVDAAGNPKSPESCNTCHGTFSAVASDSSSWAPGRSIAGDTSTTSRGVGAHQFHLKAAIMDLSNPVACNNCHSVPSSVYVQGHFDSPLPAPVTFVNQLSKTVSEGIAPSPVYDPQSLTCNNTYCHGNWQIRKSNSAFKFAYSDSVISGSRYAPVWTGGDSQDACGSCHGMPPAGHADFGSSVSTCTSCHYLDPSKQSGPLDKSTHINGKIDLYGQEYSFN